METEFIRVFDNGFAIVAEFREDMVYPTRTFVLDAENIEIRMANRKKYNLDTSQEIMALSAIESYCKSTNLQII